MPDTQETKSVGVDGFEELEAMLTKRGEPKPGPESSDLDELDALLADSMKMRDEDEQMKKDRLLLKRRGGVSADERAETEARIRAWEAKRVWKAMANVTVFERQTCKCGECTISFSHSMQAQVHRDQPGTTRVIKTDEFITDLPNQVGFADFDVPLCAKCAWSKGVDLRKEDFQW